VCCYKIQFPKCPRWPFQIFVLRRATLGCFSSPITRLFSLYYRVSDLMLAFVYFTALEFIFCMRQVSVLFLMQCLSCAGYESLLYNHRKKKPFFWLVVSSYMNYGEFPALFLILRSNVFSTNWSYFFFLSM
jgi:hypothetical protein